MKMLHQLKQANETDFLKGDEAAKELAIKPTAIRNYLTLVQEVSGSNPGIPTITIATRGSFLGVRD